MTGTAGSKEVRERLRRGELQQISVRPELVQALLDQARAHLTAAALIRELTGQRRQGQRTGWPAVRRASLTSSTRN
jgi:hypothetical protein